MARNLYWFGIRQSEIESCRFLVNGSVTIFGDGPCSFRKIYHRNINHNCVARSDEIGLFFQKQAQEILKKDPDAHFYFYNQMSAYGNQSESGNHVVGINSFPLLSFLNDKFACKEYFGQMVPILSYQMFDLLQIKRLELNVPLVIQRKYGSGGMGTFVYSSENRQDILHQLNCKEIYMVTEYCQDTIPLNVHLLVAKDSVMVFPPSIQIIEKQANYLEYKGCDYIAYTKLSNEIKKKLDGYAKRVGKELQKLGYLGVCGLDFIFYHDEIYFMEINARFQNSTMLLNRGLVESGQLTLQELNLYCFENKAFEVKKFDVNYSSYMLTADVDISLEVEKDYEVVDCPSFEVCYDEDSYVCTVVFPYSIF